MTCFWDSLRESLKMTDINNTNFIYLLKKKNTKDIETLWNNKVLTDKQKEENYTHIKDFDTNSIINGYDCSVCDPFLLLISQIYETNIIHNYINTKIEYNNSKSKNILNFSSDTGHFWFVRELSSYNYVNNNLYDLNNNITPNISINNGPIWDP